MPLPPILRAAPCRYPILSTARCLLVMVLLSLTAAVVQAQNLVPMQDVVQVAAGSGHTCALTTDGGVKCWGDNINGQLGDGTTTDRLMPADVQGLGSGVQSIAAGAGHTCALTTSGGVKCWGWNSVGQLGDGSTTPRLTPVDVTGLGSGVQAIDAGYQHTCALTTDGAVKCWGSNGNGRLGDGSTTNQHTPVEVTGLGSGVQAISTGESHTCALTTGGGMKCWGSNAGGQLGDDSTTPRLTPVDVTGLTSGVQTISAGWGYTCALTTDDGVKCWGSNNYAQLGDGTTTSRPIPADVTGLSSGVQAIRTGTQHVCALTADGSVKCWGWNSVGQLGDGSTATLRRTPVAVIGLGSEVQAITLSASSTHTCVLITSGEVKCWGNNFYGQLGDGSRTRQFTSMEVTGMDAGVQAISAGRDHSCALNASGGMACWGINYYGQLGDGSNTTWRTPVGVTGLGSDVQTMRSGGGHTCALTTSGGVKCWGFNFYGQLGDGSAENRLTPMDVTGLNTGVQTISVGTFHSCALTTNGGVKCWGNNGTGRLGDGSTANRLTPVDVSGLSSGVQAISAGREHTCALTTNGGVKCWGNNGGGRLGDGSTTNRLTPVDVVGIGSEVQAISAGSSHTCALTTGGSVKCWGTNFQGQIGDGSTTQRLVPVDVMGLSSNVQAISAGESHTCALTAGGGVKCWGYNIFGQLGDGTATQRLTPVDVNGLGNNVQAISAGYSHACALTSEGAARCWGNNQYAQLGIGGRNHGLPGNVLIPGLPEHDATLSALSLMPVPPGLDFTPVTTIYLVTVGHVIETLAFTPTASNPAATITLNGQPIASGETSAPLPLTVGDNTFTLNITAEDGITQREYTVGVVRLSAQPVALSVMIERLPDGFSKGGGEMRQYRITATNLGHQSADNVQLTAPLPVGLTDVLWTCAAPTECTPAQGENAVAVTFPLGSGQSAHVDLSGEVLPGVAFVDIRANAGASSAGVSTQGSISEPANGIGVLKDGFEP
ncbi:cadherin-like beta sandwich domain-containing protein [Xanthomonadaceae bacterium XH05]|nr:cadherin-like beta sandwich domain-containing protein [Xanthomonadaceae bacterium XH05]